MSETNRQIRDLLAVLDDRRHTLQQIYSTTERALTDEVAQLGKTSVSALIVAGLVENYYTCLEIVEQAEFGPMTQDASLYEGMLWFPTGFNAPLPVTGVGWQASGSPYNNPTGHSAPEYDAMIAAIGSAKTVEEERQLIKEADRYLIENHLYLWGPIMPQVAVTQPWIVGYNGENRLGDVDNYVIFARLWIDHQMKESMGN